MRSTISINRSTAIRSTATLFASLTASVLLSGSTAHGVGSVSLVSAPPTPGQQCATIPVTIRNAGTVVNADDIELVATALNNGPVPGTPVRLRQAIAANSTGTIDLSLCSGEPISNARAVTLSLRAVAGHTVTITGNSLRLSLGADQVWRVIQFTGPVVTRPGAR